MVLEILSKLGTFMVAVCIGLVLGITYGWPVGFVAWAFYMKLDELEMAIDKVRFSL